ncbi:MAG: peptidylprolyl isomerase [Pseudomonadota bacterium]|nr:peptidylprolyl isomerase [Pseudomonadota bacterium]
MKHFFYIYLVAPIAFFLLQAGAVSQELDRILAVVEEDVVLESELEEQIFRVREQIQAQGAKMPPSIILQRQVLERLIFDKVQISVANQVGIDVDEQTLGRAIESIAKRNEMGLEQFFEVLKEENFDPETFKQQIREEIMIAKLRKKEIDKRIRVTPTEINNYLRNQTVSGDDQDEYKISHILISLPVSANNDEIDKARKKANEAHFQLTDGTDFNSVSINFSDSPNALDGGDLGWRKRNEIPSLFADTVSYMEVNEVSPIFTNSSGFHIIKLTDQRKSGKILVQQHKARHILIKPNELTSKEAALNKLLQLRRRIEGGADFATLARTNSDDRTSALDGGDLGWVQKGQMVPEFEEVMLAGEIGEISQPFESEYGLHILQVQDRRMHDDTIMVKRQKARDAIRRQKIDERKESWLRRIRDEAYVEYRVEL